MNADLEQLVILQAQDLELKRLRQELGDAPIRVASAEGARSRAEFALAAAKQALLKEETLRRSQEVDIAERRSKITRLRKQMETATSAAQIAALEHEIQFSDQAIAKLEDEELLSLERSDEYESARLSSAAAVQTSTAALATERSSATALKSHHTEAIEAIEAGRAKLRITLSATNSGAAVLSQYDRIAKAKGTGLSEAVDHKCSACQMMVRPQRWNDLTGREHDETIFTCETCGRMLFYDPRRDAPVRWAPGEKLVGPKPSAAASAPIKVADSA